MLFLLVMMKSNSILVVEDEPLIADDIALTLTEKGYGISGLVDNAEDALLALSKKSTDLVLLDIQIKGAKDGIRLAHEVRSQFKLPFIFLTSFYDQGTLERAKLTEPLGYILKPFDERDLLINEEMAMFKARINASLLPNDKFFVKRKNEMISISASEILYAEAFDNYTKLFTADEQYIISHTLKHVEEKLTGHAFVRVHRSYLVNFHKITSINESNVRLDLVKIPLGHSYREDLLNNISLL